MVFQGSNATNNDDDDDDDDGDDGLVERMRYRKANEDVTLPRDV